MAYTYAQFKAGAPRFIMAALGPIFLEALDVMSHLRVANAALYKWCQWHYIVGVGGWSWSTF